MDKEKLNRILREVIHEARELKIPVPDTILGEVFINTRPKKRFGCCHFRDGKYQIEISEFILACEEKKIKGVLAHEVLHTCRGCNNHGPIWKEYADRMNRRYHYNIKRVSSPCDMGLSEKDHTSSAQENNDKIKYIIKCTKCGKEYPRQRYTCVMKKINAYRCQCGGKLELWTL